MNDFSRLLAVLIAVEGALDYVSTALVISKGRGTEANWFVRQFIQWFGKYWWVSRIVFLPLIVALWLNTEVLGAVFGALLVAGYGWVIYHNYLVAWRQA